ncbi:MAG: polysaccharide pyruvyl transferase family protein [Desulfobulbaceae bacterium]|nr:polysaccharide pyruvyl transferase family protein [Desulfobulbaceae bacterium]
MKIGLITTISTNIGDDFIREGLLRVVSEIYQNKHIEFVQVNKHNPYMVYPAWHPIHLGGIAKRLPGRRNRLRAAADAMFAPLRNSRFDDCSLLIQCGAPVFWPDCSRNEWAKPLWHDVVGRLCHKIPVLNLAAGSCYPWERQQDLLGSEDVAFIKSILGYCRLTTVRDRLAGNICSSLGYAPPLIPCSAFLAGKGRHGEIAESGYILINYMQGGGHYGWGQGIDPGGWEKTMKVLIARLGRRHKLAFLCHDEKEYALARELAPALTVLFPKTVQQYFAYVAGAKFGICNRMHASVAMAGLGIPSIAVCTDTRLLMVSELGLPVHYVKELNADLLEDETERLLSASGAERERLLALQQETWDKYLAVIVQALV